MEREREREREIVNNDEKQNHWWQQKNSGLAQQQDPAAKDEIDNCTMHTSRQVYSLDKNCFDLFFSKNQAFQLHARDKWASGVACVKLYLRYCFCFRILPFQSPADKPRRCSDWLRIICSNFHFSPCHRPVHFGLLFFCWSNSTTLRRWPDSEQQQLNLNPLSVTSLSPKTFLFLSNSFISLFQFYSAAVFLPHHPHSFSNTTVHRVIRSICCFRNSCVVSLIDRKEDNSALNLKSFIFAHYGIFNLRWQIWLPLNCTIKLD